MESGQTLVYILVGNQRWWTCNVEHRNINVILMFRCKKNFFEHKSLY